MRATPDVKWASHLVLRHSDRWHYQGKWKWRHCIYRLIIIRGLLSVTQVERLCWRYRHSRNYCRPSPTAREAFRELRGKSEGDRTGQHCNKGRYEIARSSTDSANIATVCDALTESPKRPCGKAPVRPGSWRPAITTFRDTILGNCKYKLPRKFLRAALHVVCWRRTPSWFKWSTWQRRILQPAVLSDATEIPHATKYGAGSLPATPARCVLHSRELHGLSHCLRRYQCGNNTKLRVPAGTSGYWRTL